MRQRKTSPTVLLLILVFFISFLALTCAPYNHNLLLKVPKVHVEEAMTFSALSVFSRGGDQYGASALLNQTTRIDIYNFIKSSPGIHFRALSNFMSLPIGVLQYHLGLLVNGGLLSTYRDGRYKRYFESKKFTETEMKVISILRHETSGKILVTLFKKPQMTHKDLAAQLNISSQALSWHMTRLGKMNFIKRSVEGLNVKYSLEETIYKTVSQHVTLLGSMTTRI